MDMINNKKINLTQFGIDSQGSWAVAPFTSINLRMEYIKNNGPKNLEKKRNLKNKSIEVIYSNSGNKQGNNFMNQSN